MSVLLHIVGKRRKMKGLYVKLKLVYLRFTAEPQNVHHFVMNSYGHITLKKRYLNCPLWTNV